MVKTFDAWLQVGKGVKLDSPLYVYIWITIFDKGGPVLHKPWGRAFLHNLERKAFLCTLVNIYFCTPLVNDELPWR